MTFKVKGTIALKKPAGLVPSSSTVNTGARIRVELNVQRCHVDSLLTLTGSVVTLLTLNDRSSGAKNTNRAVFWF